MNNTLMPAPHRLELRGGKKTVHPHDIHVPPGLVHEGFEGKVRRVELHFKRNARERRVPMMLKEFKSETTHEDPPLRNPRAQFRIMTELMELNRNQKLGLPLLRTLRIVHADGRNRLVMTPIEHVIAFKQLPPNAQNEIRNQIERATRTLNEKGYTVGSDAWIFSLDPATQKARVHLADFGLVNKKTRLRRNPKHATGQSPD